MNIYVKFPKPETLKEFLHLFYRLDEETEDCGRAVETFSDEKCLISQCPEGKWRSIEDLYDCVRTYFPDALLKDVLFILIKAKPKRAERYFYPYYCCTIRKCNIIFHKLPAIGIPASYNGDYEWRPILKGMGITIASQLYNN